jgi:hypothetical protein
MTSFYQAIVYVTVNYIHPCLIFVGMADNLSFRWRPGRGAMTFVITTTIITTLSIMTFSITIN